MFFLFLFILEMNLNLIDDKCLWNKKFLNQPPLTTFTYTKIDYEKLTSLEKLNQLIGLFEKTSSLFNAEKFLLDKLIYKNTNALRKEKSFEYMRKLKRSLSNYSELKIDGLLVTVRDLATNIDKSIIGVSSINIPSKQVYEYVLVRLLGAYLAVNNSICLIKNKILIHVMKSIKNGLFMSNNMLFLATTSRIYALIRKYSDYIAMIYNYIRPIVNLIKGNDLKWEDEFSIENLPESLTLKHSEPVREVEISNNIDSGINEDLGLPVERVEDKPTVKQTKNTDKYKKLLMKKLKIFIKLIWKKEKFGVKKFQKNLEKFIDRNLSKNKEYGGFIKELIGDKDKFKIKFTRIYDQVYPDGADKEKMKVFNIFIKSLKNKIT